MDHSNVLLEIVESTRPYAQAVGTGTLAGLAMHQSLTISRSMFRGTTYRIQSVNPINIAAGVLTGIATAFGTESSFAQSSCDNLIKYGLAYLGVAEIGAGIGALIRPAALARPSRTGVLDRFAINSWDGAVRGLIALPVAYGLAEIIGKAIQKTF